MCRSYGNTTIEEIATRMNCPSIGAVDANGSLSDALAFADKLWRAGHRQWPLWRVADTQIWTYPCSKVECGTVVISGLVDGTAGNHAELVFV